MDKNLDYIEINREAWNRRTSFHVDSDFYNTPAFIAGKSSLNSIELELLGDVKGKSILHLQCHFGLDSISLSRLGAEVTGVDLADAAINKARSLAKEIDENTKFICCDVYDLPKHLDEQFDIVFTSYGTIGWLPDMDKWAEVVSRFLKPKGKFVFVEFHPVVWMFDDDFEKIGYSYFNREAIIESTEGTYAEKDAGESFDHVSWNHPIGEVLNSLIDSKLVLNELKEYDYSPYDCFSHTEESEKGKFRIKHLGSKIPMVYSMVLEKGIG
ncbi:MAG: ubiquinone/menaquinone biosynthesis C-methylase UbiE [Flavobacteriaceae bacterium]|jgi:ubiquinone/menaquinone biosynthesis C-methylase UbiE